MIGDTRNLDGPSQSTAALDGAAVRLKNLIYGVQGALQARFNLPRPAARAMIAGTPVIPTVRYRDVAAAIEWLCRAFGMKVHRVETDSSGVPCYAELTLGSGMLMVAPIEDTAFGRLLVQPDEIGGVETQVCYLCVANAHAHHARAKAAGAVIVIDPDHEANRGRGYSCRDPEGHVWTFGTYDPWGRQPRRARPMPRWNLRRIQQAVAAVGLLAVAAGLLFEVAPQPSARASTATREPAVGALAMAGEQRPETTAAPARESGDGQTLAADARARLAEVRGALAKAERQASAARAQLADVHGALKKAERETAAARVQLHEMQRARQAAEQAAAQAREDLAAAQKSAERARADAAQERAKRIAEDRAAMRAAQRASVHSAPRRRRWPRFWCYDPNVPNPAWNSRSRLAGFCKG